MSKPNILLVGPLKQFCGWGQGLKDLARALSTIGNVTIRNIYLSAQREPNLPPDLQVLENNRFNHYDVLIQKVIPNLYYYDGRFKQNIGLMVFETEMTNHHWFNRMNMMDKMFVPSLVEKAWLKKKIKSPVFDVGETLDITIADKTYIPFNPILSNKDIFKFLFIGETTPRKGLNELLQAYLSEFTSNDNVLLIIKTNRDISREIDECKNILRRFHNRTKYPPIWLIPERMSDEQIYSLHQYSDVLVMPSYGEAFNRPAATSLVFGKPVICTDNTSMSDYIDEEIGWLIKSTKEQVYCNQPPIMELYTGKEFWYIPSVLDLRHKMRESFKYNNSIYFNKCQNIKNFNVKEEFSYKTIGQRLLKAIES